MFFSVVTHFLQKQNEMVFSHIFVMTPAISYLFVLQLQALAVYF